MTIAQELQEAVKDYGYGEGLIPLSPSKRWLSWFRSGKFGLKFVKTLSGIDVLGTAEQWAKAADAIEAEAKDLSGSERSGHTSMVKTLRRLGEDEVIQREVVVEDRMGQGIRVEVINVHPGDFSGYGGRRRDFAIMVTGSTRDVENELRKMGLRWDHKQNAWTMRSGYSDYTGKQWGEDEEKVKETLKKVQDFAREYNEKVQKANQEKITGMGMTVHTVSAEDPKEMVKHFTSLERANARLKKHGVIIEYEFANDVGGALGGISGPYKVWLVGETYTVKEELKAMGFEFGRTVPYAVAERAKKNGVKATAGWTMDGATFARIDKQVIERLIRAFEGTLEGVEDMAEATDSPNPGPIIMRAVDAASKSVSADLGDRSGQWMRGGWQNKYRQAIKDETDRLLKMFLSSKKAGSAGFTGLPEARQDLSQELREAVEGGGDSGDFTEEEMEAFLHDHPALLSYGSQDETAIDDAMEALERLHAEGVGDAVIRDVTSYPMLLALVVEGVSVSEAVEVLGEELPPGFKPGNPGNDPFATEPLHATDSAGKGGGTRPNPRSRTGECESCTCTNYVCKCNCKHPKTGKAYTKIVDMKKYKAGKKAYMAHWRSSHGPKHPR